MLGAIALYVQEYLGVVPTRTLKDVPVLQPLVDVSRMLLYIMFQGPKSIISTEFHRKIPTDSTLGH